MIWIWISIKSINVENIMYKNVLYFTIIFVAILFIIFHFKKIFFKINKWKNIVKIICTEIIFCSIIILSIKYYDMFVRDTNKNLLLNILSNLKICLEKCYIGNICLIIAVSIYFIIIYSSYIKDKQRYETIQDEYIDNIRNINSYYKS